MSDKTIKFLSREEKAKADAVWQKYIRDYYASSEGKKSERYLSDAEKSTHQ